MITGSVLHVNVSPGGVPKLPVPQAHLSSSGLAGDAHKNLKYHGGPKQALLLITIEAIEELTDLGYSIFPGALGENITTRGLDRRDWRVGQRWQIGDAAIIEFTKLRVPCKTLNRYKQPNGRMIQTDVYDEMVKTGDTSSAVWAIGGIYASVIQPGMVRAGDSLTLLSPSQETPCREQSQPTK
jgi:MOSC domain-containing protein YiiM